MEPKLQNLENVDSNGPKNGSTDMPDYACFALPTRPPATSYDACELMIQAVNKDPSIDVNWPGHNLEETKFPFQLPRVAFVVNFYRHML
jgi:hypothetical protein